MKKLIITLAIIVLFPTLALAADVTMTWEPSTGATSYKVYMSTDNGSTWPTVKDVGNVTDYVWTDAPATGLVLWRVSAYNATAEAIRTEAGVWYNADWHDPETPKGIGVE